MDKVQIALDNLKRRQFIEDTRLEARDALADILKSYDSLTDYERMVMPESFRIAIERGRNK